MTSGPFERLRQFHVVPNPGRLSQASRPFLVVIQSDRYMHIQTRLVAPLMPISAIIPFDRLTPAFEIGGRKLCLLPLDIAQVQLARLRGPVINLSDQSRRIIEAIDLVFTGI